MEVFDEVGVEDQMLIQGDSSSLDATLGAGRNIDEVKYRAAAADSYTSLLPGS